MARRRKTDGLLVALISSPWWVSVVLGCVVYVAMRWVIPSIFESHPVLAGIAMLSQSISWISFLAFLFIGAIAFVRSRTADWNSGNFGNAHIAQRARHEPPVPLHKPSVKIFDLPSASGSGNSNQTMVEVPTWTLEALRTLEWKRFELLTARYYQIVGFRSETIRCGADGGIDVKLFKTDPNKPLAIVQCKAWNTYSVGVKEVRELLGVMTHEKIGRGIFITTSTYTKDALSFGSANPIQLLDGADFLRKILELPKDEQDSLLRYAFDGDYKTPTCASCGLKMTRRDSKRGPFWGCLNYPRCKNTFAIKN